MALEFVKPTEEAFANTLLYGPAKSGKSMGAGSAPGPLLYLNADLPTATRLVHVTYGDKINEIEVKNLDTLIEVATELQANPGRWKTVVLDPVNEAYRRIIEEMSGRAVRPKINEYGDTGTHLERFCRLLCELPVNAVFVAHELALKDEESGSFERLPATGTNNPALGAKIMGMVDVIGYTAVSLPEDPAAKPRYLAQLVNGNGRRGGDRFNVLGPYREVNLTEWIDVIKSNEKAPEDTSGQTPPAPAEEAVAA